MISSLHWQTVDASLQQALQLFMKCDLFSPFRLVGGTALSLQLGHRQSVDIDLFTDAPYQSIDFEAIQQFLRKHFTYVDYLANTPIGMGKSYFVGTSPQQAIKLDIYYTEPYIQAPLVLDGVRLATLEEIVAMKMEVVRIGGRKKDFWDIHELIDRYSLNDMLQLHQQRYPYAHNPDSLKLQLLNFTVADDDFEPHCLKGKHWSLIKVDIKEWVNKIIAQEKQIIRP